MDEVIQLIGKSYGIIGLIILSPFIGIVYLWGHMKSQAKAQDEDYRKLEEKHEALHEKRNNDAKVMSEKVIEMASEQATLLTQTNASMDQIQELLMRTITGQEILAQQSGKHRG